jgi:hypothetical protein
MRLLLHPALRSKRRLISEIEAGLPSFDGGPVFVCAQPGLTAYRGKLLSRCEPTQGLEKGLSGEGAWRGAPVYAASFVRDRRIVLESLVLTDEALLRLILVHEIFHFCWPRLGNPARAEYKNLLEREFARGARGELGESSQIRKELALADQKHWREYTCESFCDTAAYLYAGLAGHAWFRLAARWRNARAVWFRQLFER